MKTLKLLPSIIAAALMGAGAHADPTIEECSSVNFKLTLRCQDPSVSDNHGGAKAHYTTWKLTNKDILNIIGDAGGPDFPSGTSFALCPNYCEDATLVLFIPHEQALPLFDYFVWNADCECMITTGGVKDDHHGGFVGHWTSEIPTDFEIWGDPENDESPIAIFCGLGKLKTSWGESHHNNLESFNLRGSGFYKEPGDECCWLVTGHVTGHGVDNASDEWEGFWNLD